MSKSNDRTLALIENAFTVLRNSDDMQNLASEYLAIEDIPTALFLYKISDAKKQRGRSLLMEVDLLMSEHGKAAQA